MAIAIDCGRSMKQLVTLYLESGSREVGSAGFPFFCFVFSPVSRSLDVTNLFQKESSLLSKPLWKACHR